LTYPADKTLKTYSIKNITPKKYLQNSKKLMYLLYISFSVSIITISELRTSYIEGRCNLKKTPPNLKFPVLL
jgi:hypothetical protein